jgi:hypothetical protein
MKAKLQINLIILVRNITRTVAISQCDASILLSVNYIYPSCLLSVLQYGNEID